MLRRPSHDLSGTLLGDRYRLVRRLGIGSVGSVYQGHVEVRDDDESRPIKEIRQIVAVKVLHENLTHDSLDVSRFKREARAAAELRHPHVVDVIDFVARAGEPPAIVMEYLVGQSLHDLLKTEHRIPSSRALRIAVQVLAALGHAHRKKVLHRDIKPENIFLIPATAGGVFVKILDFGSAKLLGEATGIPMTATGMVTGTLALMPPEQARAMRIDRRVDLYGLAATLYVAIAGRKPFGAMAPAEILAAVLNDEPASLTPLGVDGELDDILRRGLRKNPDERFQTAHEMEQSLRAWLAKHGEQDRWEWTPPPGPDLRDITPPRATTTIPPPSQLRDDRPNDDSQKSGNGQVRQGTLDGVSVDAAVPSSRLPRIASEVDLAAMPRPGGIFGRYHVHALLGTGGVSEVFRASDTKIPRTVALKVLHVARDNNETGLTTDAAARILREARLVAEMRHPNAVEVYDVDERGGLPYLVMELIEGQTFRDLVRDPFIFVEEKIAWLTDIAHALSYGHKRGIVHRDIKPENIMLRGSDRAVKVLDFGIAQRMFERGAEASEVTERIPGTPAYMAPEQMHGKDATPLTDQFAWGVVAYELLSGTHPWMQRGGMLHLVDQILTRVPDPPSRRRGDVPPEVEAVVLRALSKDPDDRYGSMDEVINALRDAWLAAKASGRPFARPVDTKATRASWRRRGLVATAVAAVVAVCGLMAPRLTEQHEHASLASSSEAERADEGSALSANVEAAAAYRAGVEAIHNAAGGAARKNLERATTLDPSFAMAHLRRVLATPWVGDAERESVRTASRLRATLGEHDRALLHAIEPWVSVPQDAVEVDRRLSALAAAHPDADTLYQLCRFRFLGGSYSKAIEACRAAEQIDPKFAGAVWIEAQSRLLLGDTPGGTRNLEACLRLSPVATSCLNDVFHLQSNGGHCTAALGYAERLVELEPENARWLDQLGTVNFAVGRPLALVRAPYDRSYGWLPAAQIPVLRAAERANLAILSGDFDEAGSQLDAAEHSLLGNTDEKAHADLFYVRALLQRELEQLGDAAALARAHAYLASRAAWSPSVEGDSSIEALVALYRGGGLSRPVFVAARAEWLEHERAQPPVPGRFGMGAGRRWLAAYAGAAVTSQDAQEALAELPNFQPLPPDRLRFTYDDEAIGMTYLMAGRIEEALPFLRRAASSCEAAAFPLQHTWANLDLGHALESTDVSAACAAYKVVIDRWASAPRSSSGRRAQDRWLALGCR